MMCTNKNGYFPGDYKPLSTKVSDKVRIGCHTL